MFCNHFFLILISMGSRFLRHLDYYLFSIFPLKNLFFSVENVSLSLHASPFSLCVGESRPALIQGQENMSMSMEGQEEIDKEMPSGPILHHSARSEASRRKF